MRRNPDGPTRHSITYTSWRCMVQRVTNPNHPWHGQYGGRGIAICQQWRASYVTFLNDVGPRPSREYSLDRIDPDGDYEPGNVRWATASEQRRNQRRMTQKGV